MNSRPEAHECPEPRSALLSRARVDSRGAHQRRPALRPCGTSKEVEVREGNGEAANERHRGDGVSFLWPI